jgi:hypothetical protein
MQNLEGGTERGAIVATWFAFCVALALALPQPPSVLYLGIGSLLGAILIVVGFAAAAGRPVVPHAPPQRAMLAIGSLLLGAALGTLLLAILVKASSAEPALRARFAGRLNEPAWRPWALAIESSILEEVVFRLFAMSAVAWIAVRASASRRVAFAIALIVSTLLFGAAHLPAWLSVAHGSPALIIAVLALNGIGGLLFGTLFWRWGLPYAIVSHFAGDVVIQSVAPRLLAQ